MTNKRDRFTAVIRHNELPAIALRNPDPMERRFLQQTVCTQWMDDPCYESKVRSGAFLQCDDEDFVLVEFWQKEYADFVQWLNDNYDRWLEEYKNLWETTDDQ